MDISIKQQVILLLQQSKYDDLLELCERDRRFWKALQLCLYETETGVIWSAIEAIAELMKRWWQANQGEKVREYIRKLLWSLNDESGGIGWNAPQTIAEIIVHIPQLLSPYGSMMIASTLEEPLLVRNSLWGIGRLGAQVRETVKLFQDMLLNIFRSEDHEILGFAAWAMGEVGFVPSLPSLEKLLDRKEPIRIYIDGKFLEKSLGVWAKEAIIKIDN
jgi:hypothetical protein